MPRSQVRQSAESRKGSNLAYLDTGRTRVDQEPLAFSRRGGPSVSGKGSEGGGSKERAELQKPSCYCSVCGRKRTTNEEL